MHFLILAFFDAGNKAIIVIASRFFNKLEKSNAVAIRLLYEALLIQIYR